MDFLNRSRHALDMTGLKVTCTNSKYISNGEYEYTKVTGIILSHNETFMSVMDNDGRAWNCQISGSQFANPEMLKARLNKFETMIATALSKDKPSAEA